MKHHPAPTSTLAAGIDSIHERLDEVSDAIATAEVSLGHASTDDDATEGLHLADLALASAASLLERTQQLVKLHRNRCIQASRGRRAA